MKLFRNKTKKRETPPPPTRTEALASIPGISPSINWQLLENGDILIEYPLQIKPFFLQLSKRFHKGQQQPAPTKKLQLDKMGSMVWQMFDGKRQVKEIIQEVARESGLSLQEAEISVTTFLRQLGQRGVILLS